MNIKKINEYHKNTLSENRRFVADKIRNRIINKISQNVYYLKIIIFLPVIETLLYKYHKKY